LLLLIELADKGVIIDIATQGGQPPIDPKEDPSAATEDTKDLTKTLS
jgi:hypothetical protein